MPTKNNEETQKRANAARIQRTEAYAEKVRLMFAQTVNDIMALNKRMPNIAGGEMYSFDGDTQKVQDEVERLLRRLHSVVTLAVQQGISLEWTQANLECDKLVQSAFGKRVAKDPNIGGMMRRNTDAMKAFQQGHDGGLKLSDRIWENCQQLREEMEVAITVAVGDGTSAQQMSQDVRKYLSDPDLMFRRFRYKKKDKPIYDPETGEQIGTEPVYGRKWKKRVKDPDNPGRYKWIDYDRDSYKTGAGVYKSSAKNAMRVTRTETNMAYRRADQQRWSQMDFVLGQRVQRSKQHPKKDICDKLEGDYPKDFKFDGWHPQCFCFVTPITLDPSETAELTNMMLEGKDWRKALAKMVQGREVKVYPEGFRQWVQDNQEKIMGAHDNGTDPYFVRRNFGAIDEILNPGKAERVQLAKRANTTANNVLGAAKSRGFDKLGISTQELEDAIAGGNTDTIKEQTKVLAQAMAAKQKQVKHTAANVAKVASDYGEVDINDLNDAMQKNNVENILAQTKALAQQVLAQKKAEAAISDLIPDAHGWHKQFTMAELQGAHAAVKSKLDSFSTLPLNQQLKAVTKELNWVADPNYITPHKQHATWQVAEAAYLKRAAIVKEQIDWLDVKNAYAAELTFKSKSVPYNTLVSKLDKAIQDGNLAEAQDLQAQIATKRKELAKAAARRTNKKAGATTSVQFGNEAYSKERKDAAVWAQNTEDADKVLRTRCGIVWSGATQDERNAIHGYTQSYHNINEPLRGITYYGSTTSAKQGLDRIPLVESIISRSRYRQDIWVQRGDSMIALKKFGLANYSSATDDEIKALVGKEGVEGAFWSAGVAKGKGFNGSIIFNIYMPRGTRAMYCEPFSAYGNGAGKNWNGKDPQYSFGYESEILIQRGTKFRVTKVQKGANGTWYIDLDVVEQKPVPFPYVGGYPFL